MILVISPVGRITEHIVNHSENLKETEWNGFSEYSVKLCGKPCIIGSAGTGKVVTALLSQHLIDKYRPDVLFFCGLCASLKEDCKIGDIIIGRDSVQHDFDVTALGYKSGEIPYKKIRLINSDKKLLEKAMLCRSGIKGIHSGRILTGDQFISDKNREMKNGIFSKLEGDCADMETAAAATAAYINNIPFLPITAVSDMGDGNINISFRKFCRKAAEDIIRILDHLLKQL